MCCSIRAYRDADFNSVLATINASARAEGDSMRLSEADLRARLATPHAVDLPIDPREDAFVAEVAGTGVVAYADGLVRGGPGAWMYRTWCFIRPEFRRQGIGRALLERLWARVQELALQRREPIILGARVLNTQRDALALFERFSMRPARYFIEMSRDLAAIPAPQLPSGLRLLPTIGATSRSRSRCLSIGSIRDDWFGSAVTLPGTETKSPGARSTKWGRPQPRVVSLYRVQGSIFPFKMLAWTR
jgi:GNAT superfamily N-acetyltransferase